MRRIHTSDRNLFKRCRRKWSVRSPLRGNKEPKSSSVSALWFGSGFHFALEDFHGYNRFGDPKKALVEYANAFVRAGLDVPEDTEELLLMGKGMLDHYMYWLEERNEFETVWIDGEPQVEVNRLIELPELGDDVVYSVTFDRVMTDTFGRWWLCDYKTAARFDTGKLDTDPQITAYLLFAKSVYPDAEFEGMVYQQFKKAAPSPPQELKTGGLSVNKNQSTTHGLYLQALKDMYGSSIPKKYVEFLNYLKSEESAEGDKFITRDFVRRNDHFRAAEYEKILIEGRDMLNPELPLYPNPTRDCSWDCRVKAVCLAMDDGSDWEQMLEDLFVDRPEEPNWRPYIEFPEEV